MALEREAGLEQLLDARLDTCGPRPGDEAERDDRRTGAEAAVARDAARPVEAIPSGDAEAEKARMPICDSRRRRTAWVSSSSFQRSSAAPAMSKPGPRFAVVAGARGKRVKAPDRGRVLRAVAGEHADDAADHCARRERPASPAADAGSQKTPSRVRGSLPAVEHLHVGNRDQRSPPERSIASTHSRCTGSTMRIAEATVSGTSGGLHGEHARQRSDELVEPARYARVFPPPPYGRVTTSGTPPSCSAISAGDAHCPSMRSSLPPS